MVSFFRPSVGESVRTRVRKIQPTVDETLRVLILHRDKKSVGESREYICTGHRQDDNVAVGGIGNLPHVEAHRP